MEHGRERAADAPRRARPDVAVRQGSPAAGRSEVLRMQRLAGNAAVTARLANRIVVQRQAKPGDIDEAKKDLYAWLVGFHGDTEKVLTTLLLQKDVRKELRQKYDTDYQRSLSTDLGVLGGDDAIRARRYLEYGTLRAADKIYIAIHGKLTDNTTVMRVVKEIGADRAAAEQDFAKEYGAEYPQEVKLPNGQSSRIAGALMKEMLSADFADRFRVLATLAFGKPRAADDVKIATVQPTNNDELLFDALQREKPETLRTDFEKSYDVPLKDYLSRETSLHTKARALMLIDPDVREEDRLIRTVEIATSGYTTADADFIFDAVRHASDRQLEKFRAALASKDPRLKDIDATFGGMNKEQRSRFDALVGVGDNSGILGDPVVKRLRAEGGAGSDGVFETLKNATGPGYAEYKANYTEGTPLYRFTQEFLTAPQKGWLLSYVFAPFKDRLNYVMTNPGYDDYIVFLLSGFADAAMRRDLAKDADFGSGFTKLSTATQNKLLMVMRPDDMTPQERAVWLDQAVKRETAGGAGSITAAAGALADENRELQAAKARAEAGGKPLTADQQAELDRLASKTEGALQAFIKYRDELEATVDTAVGLAASILAGLATGGVATVEFALASVARAAVANAMAKVISKKIVLGDRFDVIGADGAAAFVSGAVDGALNVVTPGVSKALSAPGLQDAAGTAARAAAPSAFGRFVAGPGAKMAEAALSGGVSGAVDTMVQDATWVQGFDKGMGQVLRGAAIGAAAGAVPAGGGALAGELAQLAGKSAAEASSLVKAGMTQLGPWQTVQKGGGWAAVEHAIANDPEIVGRLEAWRRVLLDRVSAEAGEAAAPDAAKALRSTLAKHTGLTETAVETALGIAIMAVASLDESAVTSSADGSFGRKSVNLDDAAANLAREHGITKPVQLQRQLVQPAPPLPMTERQLDRLSPAEFEEVIRSAIRYGHFDGQGLPPMSVLELKLNEIDNGLDGVGFRRRIDVVDTYKFEFKQVVTGSPHAPSLHPTRSGVQGGFGWSQGNAEKLLASSDAVALETLDTLRRQLRRYFPASRFSEDLVLQAFTRELARAPLIVVTRAHADIGHLIAQLRGHARILGRGNARIILVRGH